MPSTLASSSRAARTRLTSFRIFRATPIVVDSTTRGRHKQKGGHGAVRSMPADASARPQTAVQAASHFFPRGSSSALARSRFSSAACV